MDWNDQPECPHCEAKMDLGEAHELRLEDDESQVVDCGNCNGKYQVTARIYTEWSTRSWTALDEARRQLGSARAVERGTRGCAYSSADIVRRFNDETCRLEVLVERLAREERDLRVPDSCGKCEFWTPPDGTTRYGWCTHRLRARGSDIRTRFWSTGDPPRPLWCPLSPFFERCSDPSDDGGGS